MKSSKLCQSLVATLAIFALGAPAIASADDKSDFRGVSMKVSYADLNLEKSEGVKTSYRRLQKASRHLCEYRTPRDERSIEVLSDARQCYHNTLSAAVEKIDNELLTQIHNK
jgi:UrcA family protein